MSDPHDIVPEGVDAEVLATRKAAYTTGERRRCLDCGYVVRHRAPDVSSATQRPHYCNECKRPLRTDETVLAETREAVVDA